MDFLIEILIQVFVEFVVELLGQALRGSYRGASKVIGGRAVAWITGTLVGVVLGYLWGGNLAGQATWPKLFWVSVTLGVVAFALGVMRSGAWPSHGSQSTWRRHLTPPWQWDSERLFGFALINLGIVIGIALGFGPSWSPRA